MLTIIYLFILFKYNRDLKPRRAANQKTNAILMSYNSQNLWENNLNIEHVLKIKVLCVIC